MSGVIPPGAGERPDRDDPGAFATLFDAHRERLWRVLHFRLDRRVAARVDVDDVLQDVFLDASQRVEHYRKGDYPSFFLWLRLVAMQTLGKVHRRHLATDMRSAAREADASAVWSGGDTSASLSDHLLSQLTSPSQAVIRRELAGILRSALDAMNPIDREVLALRHFEELTNTEVAQVLGIQQKAASIRYMRALERLRGILGRFPGLASESSQGK